MTMTHSELLTYLTEPNKTIRFVGYNFQFDNVSNSGMKGVVTITMTQLDYPNERFNVLTELTAG